MLYFVEDTVHTPHMLARAIEAGADAYVTCVRVADNGEADLDMKLVYCARGVALDHRLAVSAVLAAQNLTPFQVRVMHCLRDGVVTDREIALRLEASEPMVGKTIGQLFGIFGCNRRSTLAKHSVHM